MQRINRCWGAISKRTKSTKNRGQTNDCYNSIFSRITFKNNKALIVISIWQRTHISDNEDMAGTGVYKFNRWIWIRYYIVYIVTG